MTREEEIQAVRVILRQAIALGAMADAIITQCRMVLGPNAAPTPSGAQDGGAERKAPQGTETPEGRNPEPPTFGGEIPSKTRSARPPRRPEILP